jgi:protein-tyrosine-phosphatase
VAADPFDIVFICTGNRFRSVIGAGLMKRLTEGMPVRTTSAGTLDLGPVEALPEALELAPSLDLDLTEHRARCVRNVDLSEADLVLGFEYQHLAAAVTEGEARRERTFTLPELVVLLEEGGTVIDGGDLVAGARRAVQRAADDARPGGHRLEIADPLGASPEVFHGTALEVRALTERLAELLFGARSR